MLKVEMRALDREDLVLEECGWAQALGIELNPELCREPLDIHCKLVKNGDLVSATGWVKGKMLLTCDRCTQEFESCYKSYFEIHYRQQPEEMLSEEEYTEDQVEIVYFDGELLDIADQIRQTILLSVPMRALCKEDCKGLCGGCGRNLNVEKCQCSGPPPDGRWSKLREIKF